MGGVGARAGTDLDHLIPFTGTDAGGSTSAANLHCLCRRHHKVKTHHRWRVTRNQQSERKAGTGQPDISVADGSTWTSPRGKQHTVDPPRQLEAEPVVGDDELRRRSHGHRRPGGSQPKLNQRRTKLEVTLGQVVLAA